MGFKTHQNGFLIVGFLFAFLVHRGWCTCRQNITGYSSGYIASPNYPYNYSNNEDCLWGITVPVGYKVQLIFVYFDTEEFFDEVEFYDGLNQNSPYLGGYSAKNFPPVLTSSGRSMLIKFTSDHSIVKGGFYAKFNAVSAVDGSWSLFGNWTECNKPCEGGTQQRTRTCTNPPPANGGSVCTGSHIETRSCNNHSCPVNGNWTEWGDWSECTKCCTTKGSDAGTQERKRTCTNPSPDHNGADCVGPSLEYRKCNTHECQADCSQEEFHPHETDCSRFYQCDNGVPRCLRCPSNLYWDINGKRCNWPHAVNCANGVRVR